MKTPQEFRQQLQQFDGYAIEIDSVQDAKDAVKDCIRMQREARAIKKDISATIAAVRQHYRERAADAGSKEYFLRGAIFGRKAASSARADDKRWIARERDDTIAPYQLLKATIDGLLAQLEQAKNGAKDYIEDAKREAREVAAPKEAVSDALDQLERLKSLHDAGIVTDDEFQRMKRTILGDQ